MKLKLFEDFESEEYYKRITSDYAYRLLGSQCIIPLTESDKEEIKKVYCDTSDKMFAKKIDGRINQLYPSKNVRFHINEESSYVISLYTSNLIGMTKVIDNQNIFLLDDEWFILYCRGVATNKSPHLFYKCDQIDGLVKCLEDNMMRLPPKL